MGPPEIVDSGRRTSTFAVVLACVVAGLALSLWALTDSLSGSGSTNLPRLEVPSVSTLTLDQAQATLEKAGFVVQLEFQPNEEQAKGVVIGQRPLAGSKVEQGELVKVLVSDGPLGLTVPDVKGQQATDAEAALLSAGVRADQVPTPSETVRPGEVMGTDPPVGRRVATGGTVHLLVSSGPAPRVVPAVVGQKIEQVLAALGRAGLGVGDITRVVRPDLPEGQVFALAPAPGAALPRDTPVAVSVAAARATVTVPYFVGLHEAGARTVASSAKLNVTVVTSPVAPGDPVAGRVIAQSVPPQAEVDPSTPIELTVAQAQVAVAPPSTAAPGPGG